MIYGNRNRQDLNVSENLIGEVVNITESIRGEVLNK